MRTVVVAVAAILLCACANVEHTPATLTYRSVARTDLKVPHQVPVQLPTHYEVQIPGGSHWRYAGSLPQGDVYRPVNTALTIKGHHAHEAYLVVVQDALVGFYLPGDSAFSTLPTPVPLFRGDHQ